MKKILFFAPRRGGWPAELYKNIIQEFQKNTSVPHHFQYATGIFSWIFFHFFGKKYDIIVTNVPFFWRPFSKKFFLNIHGDIHTERKKSLLHRIFFHLYCKNMQFSDEIIFPSKWLANRIAPNHHTVIPNIICVKNPPNSWKNSEKNIFFTITNFHFQQKCEWIQKIIDNLEKRWEKYNFHIFWGGKFLSKMRNATPKTENSIVFHNFQPKTKIFETMKHKNAIFIYHSHLDIIPTSLVEAILCDFRVLVAPLAPFEEFFHSQIFYTNFDNFCEKLQKMSLQTENREKIAKIFNNSKNLSTWLKLFE